jgi:hypothetical protein
MRRRLYSAIYKGIIGRMEVRNMATTGKDLIKHVTESFVKYIDTPKETRKQTRAHEKEAWQYRWFGMMPVTLHVWKKKIKREKPSRPYGRD